MSWSSKVTDSGLDVVKRFLTDTNLGKILAEGVYKTVTVDPYFGIDRDLLAVSCEMNGRRLVLVEYIVSNEYTESENVVTVGLEFIVLP